MYDALKQKVLAANLLLPQHNLVTFTWGNVSEIDREAGAVAIKPTGVEYDKMTLADIVVVDFATGLVIDGRLKPSSDLQTHLEIYKAFENVCGVVHTHSRWATTMAQAGISIQPFGTTHADYFYGEIPCTRRMTPQEVSIDYEKNTGCVITETFKNKNADDVPGALVHSHGAFAWGHDSLAAVHNAVVLEEVSFMAWHSLMINRSMPKIEQELLDKHYLRKHGKKAYYGQS